MRMQTCPDGTFAKQKKPTVYTVVCSTVHLLLMFSVLRSYWLMRGTPTPRVYVCVCVVHV